MMTKAEYEALDLAVSAAAPGWTPDETNAHRIEREALMRRRNAEYGRRMLWHRTYNASLTGLRAAIREYAFDQETGRVIGGCAVGSAETLREYATADADALHGSIK